MATRTSRADKNWLSISANIGQWYAGTPTPTPAVEPYPSTLVPLNPLDWDAILKVCDGTTGLTLVGMNIAQGRENVVDLNNGATDIGIAGYLGTPLLSGDQVITVKGGCKRIRIGGTVVSAKPKSGAIVIVGNWSDQSYEPSTDVDLTGLAINDGSPVTVILGRVNNPLRAIVLGHHPDIHLPAGAKVLVLKSLGLWAYWWMKRAYVWAIWKWHVAA